MALKKTSTTVALAVPSAAKSDKLTGDAALAPTVDKFWAAHSAFETAKANKESAQADLIESAFNTWIDQKGAAGTVQFTGTSDDRKVNVSCKDQYSALPVEKDGSCPALDQVVSIIGEEIADTLFSYDEELKISIDLVDEDKRAAFVEGVQQLAAAMGISQDVMKFVQRPSPIKAIFHTARHSKLTPAQNRALQPIVKTVISVTKVK